MAEYNELPEELNIEDLEQAAGGVLRTPYSFDDPSKANFKWNIGDHVELIIGYFFTHERTLGCTIIDRNVSHYGDTLYCCWYLVKCSEGAYSDRWYMESDFQHGAKSSEFRVPV